MQSLDIEQLSARFAAARVLVVGDVMLDRYWFGEVDRISPEAPVPVVCVAKIEERLGGAANVARNITALGARVTLMAVVGKDDAASSLKKLLDDAKIDSNLMVDPMVSTTVKLRILGRQQQLLRADFESIPDRDMLSEQLGSYDHLLDHHDIVILSDYGKGGLAHIIEMIDMAKAKGKQVIIDPKGDDYERYRHATAITPNRAELRQVTGLWHSEEDLAHRARHLLETLNIDALLLTRSEEGMTLFTEKESCNEATVAKEVFDVSGAGDTVIAVFSTALAIGCTWLDAMKIANCAASVVVSKVGTAVASWPELKARLIELKG